MSEPDGTSEVEDDGRAPRTAAPPLWPVTLALAVVCGALLGGLAVHLADDAQTGRSASAAAPGGLATERPRGAPEIDLGRDAPLEQADAEPRDAEAAGAPPRTAPPAAEVVAEAPPPDTSPEGLRKRFGAAVVSFEGEDAEGDPRPAAPAVVVGLERVLVPLSAVEGTTRGRVTGTSAGTFAVTGIVVSDRALDLALLAVDAPLPDPALSPADVPVGAPVEAVILGSARDAAGSVAPVSPVSLAPGAADRFSGAPRLSLTPPASSAGAVIDREGRLLALVPAAGEDARPLHAAASWPDDSTTPIPLERFLELAGPGAPASRVATARKLLEQRRYDEAARLLLTLTAAEPRLLEEVGDDLRLAALEAARGHLTAGRGPTAVVLLTEALARRPDDAELWAARGRAHAVAGDVPPAVDAFARAVELDPSRADAWRSEARGVLIGEVNRLHGSGLLDVALSLLLDHRALFPGDGGLRVTAAGLLLEDRRFAAAAAMYDEAAVLDARVAAEAREGARRARDLAGGPGAIVIDFPPGATQVVVEARIDDRVTTRLEIDPSQDLCAVPPGVARAARYSLAGAPRVRWDLDPTVAEVHVIELRSVVVGGVGTGRVRAAVVEGAGGAGADGVLGASFLGRYRRVEDRALGRMVLWPR